MILVQGLGIPCCLPVEEESVLGLVHTAFTRTYENVIENDETNLIAGIMLSTLQILQ